MSNRCQAIFYLAARGQAGPKPLSKALGDGERARWIALSERDGFLSSRSDPFPPMRVH